MGIQVYVLQNADRDVIGVFGAITVAFEWIKVNHAPNSLLDFHIKTNHVTVRTKDGLTFEIHVYIIIENSWENPIEKKE